MINRPSSFAVLALATAALAQGGHELPGTFKASELLSPALRKGPHFQVKEEVPTVGYFHLFEITSDFGSMEAEGHSLLLTRLSEVDALARLQDVSKSEVFLSAAGNSVLNVGKGVVNVVADPGGTAKGLGGGIKRFGTNLGRKTKRGAESASEAVTGDDQKTAEGSEKSTGGKAVDASEDVAMSALGVNGAMRRWAQKLQVDPYTSNKVLRKALEDVGKIDSAGGIAAKVVVPVPMVLSATASVGGLVWGKDPEELLKLNEQRVGELGVDKKTAAAFFKNKAFRLGYQTRLIAALYAVKAKGCGSYVDTAEEAETERQVVFFTESAELLQRFHQGDPVEAILPDSRAIVAKTKAGKAVVLVALDYLPWSEAADKAVAEAAARAKAELKATSLEIRITGRASDLARQQMKARGWSIVENVPGSLPEPKSPGR
jgi:hypothetical protein